MESRARLHDLQQRFDLVVSNLLVENQSLRIAQVRNWETLVDRMTDADFTLDEQLPYWAKIWPSALALAEALAKRPIHPGEPVLELGAGLGLVGLSLALRGAKVTVTDISPDALEFLEVQAALNEVELTVRQFDWRESTGIAKWPLIVAADVLYEQRMAAPFLQALQQLLTPEGEAWVADPFRSPADEFGQLARAAGLRVEVWETHSLQAGLEQRVRVFTLRP